jgi:hypothetical protein
LNDSAQKDAADLSVLGKRTRLSGKESKPVIPSKQTKTLKSSDAALHKGATNRKRRM